MYNEFATFASICVLPAARQAVLTEAEQPLTCGVMSVCWGTFCSCTNERPYLLICILSFYLFIFFS